MGRIELELDQLRGMIGVRVTHEGMRCVVIEVLEDGPSLVLQQVGESVIQPNQFGDPQRRVPATCTVPVLTADRTALHPAFLALELDEEE